MQKKPFILTWTKELETGQAARPEEWALATEPAL